MKKFFYNWGDDIFLLHIQLDNPVRIDYSAVIKRNYEKLLWKEENLFIDQSTKSHRFIVSRTHPMEESFFIEYPDEVLLEAFKIQDRAFYPTESFFKG